MTSRRKQPCSPGAAPRCRGTAPSTQHPAPAPTKVDAVDDATPLGGDVVAVHDLHRRGKVELPAVAARVAPHYGDAGRLQGWGGKHTRARPHVSRWPGTHTHAHTDDRLECCMAGAELHKRRKPRGWCWRGTATDASCWPLRDWLVERRGCLALAHWGSLMQGPQIEITRTRTTNKRNFERNAETRVATVPAASIAPCMATSSARAAGQPWQRAAQAAAQSSKQDAVQPGSCQQGIPVPGQSGSGLRRLQGNANHLSPESMLVWSRLAHIPGMHPEPTALKHNNNTVIAHPSLGRPPQSTVPDPALEGTRQSARVAFKWPQRRRPVDTSTVQIPPSQLAGGSMRAEARCTGPLARSSSPRGGGGTGMSAAPPAWQRRTRSPASPPGRAAAGCLQGSRHGLSGPQGATACSPSCSLEQRRFAGAVCCHCGGRLARICCSRQALSPCKPAHLRASCKAAPCWPLPAQAAGQSPCLDSRTLPMQG